MSSKEVKIPEEMDQFFDVRADGYEEHMQQLEFFEEFYTACTAPVVPTREEISVLDLGCGTGLELADILSKAPNARITGIDLSGKMLARLRDKFREHLNQFTLIQGSYLALPFPGQAFDYAISVQTMHHFLSETKVCMYSKIKAALKPGGKYIEGDYCVSPEESRELIRNYYQVMLNMDEPGQGMYHIDIPFTAGMQEELLREAGFKNVEVFYQNGNAAVFVAD